MSDERYMQIALRLAKRVLGNTAPNPAVGCVIIKNGRIISTGNTSKTGRPHAEVNAIESCTDKNDLIDASMYVTLEPCCHYGVTPPCTDAIIKSGIKNVIIATQDKDLRVNGKSIEILKSAGIKVTENICNQEAELLNKGFFKGISQNLPLVTLKLATTLDGKIALSNGKSKWITSKEARRYGNLLRSQHDAIMVGIGTILEDDPTLDVRIKGLETNSPIKIIIDRDLKISPEAKVIKLAETQKILIITSKTNEIFKDKFPHVKFFYFNTQNNNYFDMKEILSYLKQKEGITRVFCEGGKSVATNLLKNNLVDDIIIFRSPKIIGGDGMNVIGNLNKKNMEEIFYFSLQERVEFSDNICEFYRSNY